MEYAQQYHALCLTGSGNASASAPRLALDGSVPFTLDAMVRGIPVAAEAAVLHQEGALDLKLTAKGFRFWREGFGTLSTSGDADLFRLDEWNHLCIAYEPGTVRLFINGVLNQVVRKTCAGSGSSQPFVLGDGIQGEMRQVRLFDRAFGAMEVQETLLMDYADLKASSYAAALAAYYDLSVASPVERVSNSTIALKGDAEMRTLIPAARLQGNAYLAISNEPAINPAGRRNDAYSIQAWIRLEPFEGQDLYTVFANGDQMEEAGMSLYVARDQTNWRLCTLRGDEEPQMSRGVVSPGTWMNVCVTYDGLQTQSLYLDGMLDSQISTCLPIPDVLEEPRLRIGADLSHGDDNGKDCFSGSISRVDIWNRALSADEVDAFAASAPPFDEKGLLASYDLSSTDANNVVSADPPGLRNGVALVETVQDPAKAPPPPAAFEVAASEWVQANEPLGEKELQRCRAACLEGVDTAPGSSAAPLRVSRLEKDGRVYFVGHYRDSSQTIAEADAALDEWTLWFVELVVLLVGGALFALAGIKMRGGGQVTAFIRAHVLPNPAFRALFANPVSFKTIITFFYLLKQYGLLTSLLKSAMSGLGWFKVAWSIGVMIAMAVALCTGVGLVYYGVVFADLVVSIVLHLTNMPSSGSLLPCSTTGLFFDHHAVTSTAPLPANEVDAITLALDGVRTVPKPEWDSGANFPCAYAIEAVRGKKITVKADFECTDSSVATLKVRALDKSSGGMLFGDSDEAVVSLSYKRAQGVTIAFPSHTLASKGVGKHELKLEWQCYYQNEWKKMTSSTHVVYTLLAYPNEPWLSGSGKFPWIPLLDQACTWATGKKTPIEVACAIEKHVNGHLGLVYDVAGGGASHYCIPSGYFLLNDFLSLKSKVVNCTDCATIVTTYANALGCDLFEARMHDPALVTAFSYVAMQSIGTGRWKPGAFIYHEVAVGKKAAARRNQNRAVYDACCVINGSTDPAKAAGRDPMLPGGISFSDYDDGLRYPYPAPKRASYREHFATNNAAGIGLCRYNWLSEQRRPTLP